MNLELYIKNIVCSMNRLQSFINKYYKWIILILLVLLMLKSCNGCSSKRRYNYKISQYELKIDSLESTLKSNLLEYKYTNDSLKNELFIVKSKNDVLNSTIENVRKDVDHYRSINKDLVNVTEHLSQVN